MAEKSITPKLMLSSFSQEDNSFVTQNSSIKYSKSHPGVSKLSKLSLHRMICHTGLMHQNSSQVFKYPGLFLRQYNAIQHMHQFESSLLVSRQLADSPTH